MIALNGRWVGDLRGTLVGNLFAEFSQSEEKTVLTLRANVSGAPAVVRGDVAVGETTSTATLEGVVGDGAEGTPARPIKVDVVFEDVDQQGIRGRWEMPDGNAGTLALAPVAMRVPVTTAPSTTTPMQVVQRTKQLPKITIYRDEVQELVASMKALLPTTYEVIIKADVGGKEIRRFAPDFWALPSLPVTTGRLNLWLSEPGETPRSINISLSVSDCSYTVTGSDDVWVTGTFHEIGQQLSRKHGRWRAVYEQHALTLNAVAVLLALVLAPSLDLLSRFLLLGGTVLLAILFKWLHSATTALRVHLKSDFKETSFLDLPRVATTVAGTGVVAFVAWAFNLLNSGAVRGWLELLLSKS